MRESRIERHLKISVRVAGGATKKMKNTNDPDQLVIWPSKDMAEFWARIHFVECKAPGKKPRPAQAREHARLRDLGCRVFVLDTIEKVDNYVKANT